MPRRAVVAALVLSGVLAGCGVPTSGRARPVPDDELPASLRSDATTTTTTTSVDEADQAPVIVYLIRDDELVPVRDSVPAPADLDAVLRLLQRGPTEVQAQDGDRSALTGVDLLRRTDIAGSSVSIDLDPSFAETPPSDQILALAQIVLTATARPGISTVRFTLDDEPASVPRGDGSLTESALTRLDYEVLLAK